jgi:prepilin-type N-terminal cleavage/methylation domain-containing protein
MVFSLHRAHRSAAAFTLIELLVVVAIIAVLSALITPAVQGLMGTSGRRGALNTVTAVLEQARLSAVENGTTAYVGFPTNAANKTNGFSHLIVFRDARPGDTNANPVAVTRWQRLPNGVFFKGGIDFPEPLPSKTFPTNTLQVNKWQYIILNRNASTQVETMWVGTFVNTSSYVTCGRATGAAGGTSQSGGTQVNNLDYTGVCNWIGRFYGGYWPGFITNLRVTVGMAVYNSTSATVTAPSVPLSSWANTKYLMLGAAVTTDTSGTQTVTNNGTVTQNASKPF